MSQVEDRQPCMRQRLVCPPCRRQLTNMTKALTRLWSFVAMDTCRLSMRLPLACLYPLFCHGPSATRLVPAPCPPSTSPPPQVILSLTLPFAVFPLVQFTSSRRYLGAYANKVWVSCIAWFMFLLISGLNINLVVQSAITGTFGNL